MSNMSRDELELLIKELSTKLGDFFDPSRMTDRMDCEIVFGNIVDGIAHVSILEQKVLLAKMSNALKELWTPFGEDATRMEYLEGIRERVGGPKKATELLKVFLARTEKLLSSIEQHGSEQFLRPGSTWLATVRANEIADSLDHIERTIQKVNPEVGNLEGTIQNAISQTQGLIQSEVKKSAADFAQELEGLRARFLEDNRQKSSLKLWEHEIEFHKTQSWWSFGFCSVFAILIVLGAIGLFKDWFSLKGTIDIFTFDAVTSLAVILLLFSILMIGFRTTLRIALSHKHMQIENNTRASLMAVYLSFLEETIGSGAAVTEEQRAIIIGALFRPSTVGIVKDEGYSVDPSLIAALSKALSPKT